MRVTRLRTNRLENPLGFQMDRARISYVVCGSEGSFQKAARIMAALDEDFQDVVYDSGESTDINSICFELPIKLEPRTRYYWKVKVWSDAGEEAESSIAWFETAKGMGEAWKGYFITQTFAQTEHPVMEKVFTVDKPVKQARFYGLGLGVYELYLNGEKVSDEYLLPGIHAYDSWLQYQTFEIALGEGNHTIRAMLGDGWYKGAYGLKSQMKRHGDEYAFIAEIHIIYEDGSRDVIVTDESWCARKGKVVFDSIYDGEVYDERISDAEAWPVKKALLGTERLQPRLSPYILIHERIRPVAIIRTPAGETVLDMGQNMVGFMECKVDQSAGTRVHLSYGEILQEGNFYRDNLRTAKCEYTYISDGTPGTARSHFTFYGFRYVKVEGYEGEIHPDDFTGCVIHSHMEETGIIETSHPLVNQLVSNIRWGQKGNFLDIPTDCPQRDERMGWTGDAQIFADTACFNMDTYAFYTKFMKDLAYEQEVCGGSVPYVVPMSRYELGGATTWGDAATIIPWVTYLHYGDKVILEDQFHSMKAWVEYIRKADEDSGGRRIWSVGRHFGDWLALDGKVDGGVYGSTENAFIATAYYYYSAVITGKAAGVLGYAEEEAFYTRLSEEIKRAFYDEYYTGTGRLSMNTQTGYALVIFMGLIPEGMEERTYFDFKEKLKENSFQLNTGFVGTAYLCLALAESGYQDLAYDLLLNEKYPGWLYEVKMGATTVWERWNSVLPDGSISGTGMNSLNHYAYGSVEAWMYRYMLGIRPVESEPGFKRAVIAPEPGHHFEWVRGEVKTPAGDYRISWSHEADRKLKLEITIPFGAAAEIVLPRVKGMQQGLTVKNGMGKEISGDIVLTENGSTILNAGTYIFVYDPVPSYRRKFGMDSNLNELMENPGTRDIIMKYFPRAASGIPFQGEGTVVEEIAKSPFAEVSDEALAGMKRELEEFEL